VSHIHDLFLITKADGQAADRLSHIKVDAAGIPDKLERDVGFDYPGHRKVMKLAQPSGRDIMRGAGFTILPNRPDPDTSQMCCFLVNARNLRDVNPWNATEWSQSEDHVDNSLPLDKDFATTSFEALLAGPGGEVYYVQRADADAQIKRLSPEELAVESELWVQLRNGLVAGCVAYQGCPSGAGRIVALMNMTAVMPKAPDTSIEQKV